MGTHSDDYDKAIAVTLPGDHRDEERVRVNWNLTFDAAVFSGDGPSQEPTPRLPDDFKGINTPALMHRLRALASQI